MTHWSRPIIVTLAFTTVTLALAPSARATCVVPDQKGAVRSSQLGGRPVLSAYSSQSSVRASDHDSHEVSIVGLWQVTFVAQGTPGIPDGTVIDAGYATWHSDETEIMNSGRPPATGSFCMGVWKQISQNGYKLNHVAISWDPSGQTMIGPANIREEVRVNRTGDHYEGTFTIDQFDLAGNTLAHLAGRLSADRITAD